MNKSINLLFKKYKLGDLALKNRFVMASMTRARADPKTGIPTASHIEYYSQRASAGLILTECAPISNNGQSFLGNGGIYTPEQVAGWKKVVDAVHAKGSKIFLQIWHAGRSAAPALIGEPNIGPSPIAIRGNLFPGVDHVVPKEMTHEDITLVLQQFKQGALNAKAAGFDGVELHGANGYLIDEFLRDSANKRTDAYGGSVENRSRLCLEVIDELISVFGAKRVGIKLSPVARYQDMNDSDPFKLYSYLLKQLDEKGIVYVQLVQAGEMGGKSQFADYPDPETQMPNVSKQLRPYFKGTIIINNKQTPESAVNAIHEGDADLVSFARSFLANPDYVERVKNNWPLNDLDFGTLYTGGDKGYIDYPFHKAPAEKGFFEKLFRSCVSSTGV